MVVKGGGVGDIFLSPGLILYSDGSTFFGLYIAGLGLKSAAGVLLYTLISTSSGLFPLMGGRWTCSFLASGLVSKRGLLFESRDVGGRPVDFV